MLTPNPLEEVRRKLGAIGLGEGQAFITRAPHRETPGYLAASDFAFTTIKLAHAAFEPLRQLGIGLPVLPNYATNYGHLFYLERFSGWCTGHPAPLSFGEGLGARFSHCTTYTNLRTAVVCRSLDERTVLIAQLRQLATLAMIRYQPLHQSSYYVARHDSRSLP